MIIANVIPHLKIKNHNKMLNRTEKNRVLGYAKVAYKKEAAVNKLLAKKEAMLKKYTEYYDKKIQESPDYLEYTMNLNMMRVLLKNNDAKPSDVIEERVDKKEIMGKMCNTRSYKPTTTFLSLYCGITQEEAEEESAPSMTSEATTEIAEDVEVEEVEEEKEPANDDIDIPADLSDDF